MNGKRILALLLTAALLTTGAAVLAGGASGADPLVSLSYLKQIFVKPVEEHIQTRTAALLSSSLSRLDAQTHSAALGKKLDAALAAALEQKVLARVSAKLAASGASTLTAGMKQLTLSKGDKLVGAPGAGIVVKSGSGKICGPAGANVLNVTAGGLRASGAVIREGIYYMVLADDGSGVEITSASATVLVRDGAHVAGSLPAYTAQYAAYADALRTLGLFFGSDKGYELDRAPTRQEALIMLIRLLGEEKNALAYTEKSTFGDVTGWLDGQKYIAYGQHKGYTNGAGKLPDGRLQFCQRDDASLDMYLTFVLRALGYSDAAGDFVWNSTSRTLAVKLGLLTEADIKSITAVGFRRDHVVYISYHALWANLKNSTATLGDKLVTAGVVSRTSLTAAAGLK